MKNICILVICMICNSSYAQNLSTTGMSEGAWQKLSLTTVNFDQQTKEVLIAGREQYNAIYFAVTSGQIQIKSVEVLYASSDKQNLQVNETVKAGSKSKEIQLSAEAGILKRILLSYLPANSSNDTEARLEVWGLRK